ncbi:MAG: alanine racemase [Pseudomonadota bacterium]
MSSASASAASDAVLTIDLDALAGNYRKLSALVAPARCAAVVKANAYGTGIDQAAPCLWKAGARLFFVAQLQEGLTVRDLLPDAEIGILNGLMPGAERVYRDHRLIPVLNDFGQLRRWSDEASRVDQRLPAFIHLDTGMNRLGLEPNEQKLLVDDPGLLSSLDISGWLTHLACADDRSHPMTVQQRSTFAALVERLPPAPASLANSYGIFHGSELHFDIVRPGCALYGVNPTPEAANPMHQIVRLDARILQTRRVDRHMSVGYGADHSITQPGKIATIAAGYADGLLRATSGKGSVCIAGHVAPVVGRLSMDLITVDVTHIPENHTTPGSMATIIGAHRTVDDVAREAGTIGYEVLTSLGARYARRYTGADG